MKTRTCSKCKQRVTKYTFRGVWPVCDSCAGVIRDAKGYAWKPGESEMTLIDINTGALETIERPANDHRHR